MFLGSDAASYISGTVIACDRGAGVYCMHAAMQQIRDTTRKSVGYGFRVAHYQGDKP
jgi:methyl coenzyme M reductase alpha subunit